MSICRAISCVVGKGCLLWPICCLGKTLLPFASMLHFALQSQTCLLLQISLDFLLLQSSPLWWKLHLCFFLSFFFSFFFLMLVLEGLVGLHRTGQLQLLRHQCLRHRLRLLWCLMVCLGNKQVILSFLRLHPRTAFWTLLLTIRSSPFLLRDSCLQ